MPLKRGYKALEGHIVRRMAYLRRAAFVARVRQAASY